MIKIPKALPIRIRKPTKIEIIITGGLILFFLTFISGRKSVKLLPEAPSPLEKIETKIGEVNLPEVLLESTPFGSSDGGDEGDSSEVTNIAKLKVLNANLIGVYSSKAATSSTSEESSPAGAPPSEEKLTQLTGIRILGEVQNIGNKKAQAMKAIVRFYNPQKELVASKVANFNQGYYWLPLSSNETNVYDILVPNPPESETITVEMMPTSGETTKNSLDSLKIKDKNLESASLKRGQDELAYFKFKAILINTSTEHEQIINPGLYVWLKNDEGKVIGLGSKVFEADILSANQELEVNLILTPLATGTLFGYEAKTFGENLQL